MAPKATTTGSRAAQPATSSSSAAKPATASSSAAQSASPPFREPKKMSSTLAVEAEKPLDMSAPEAWTGSADQPSLQNMNTHHVSLPAHETSFKTLKDLRQWLHHLSEPDQSSAHVCRFRNVLCVLELQSSRDTRKQIQALLKDWDITQYQNASRKKRSLPHAQQRLSSAVLAEGSRLQSLTRSAGSLTSHANFERMFRNGEASLDLNATARARSRSNRRHISID